MGHRTRLASLPERIAAGAFIANAGAGKLQSDPERSARVHAMAAGTFPVFEGMTPTQFVKLLGASEVALGGALVLPLVGDGLAGAALTAFAGALLAVYWRTPGMRKEGSILPSQAGTAIAKDVWLLGIGLSLVAGSRHHRRHHGRRSRRAAAA
jgi:hypothetical protein